MILEALWMQADITWCLTAVIGLLTLFIARHLLIVRSFPSGPFPLPVLGNLLAVTSSLVNLTQLLRQWREKYGDVYTVWFGSYPTLIVSGWDLCKEGLVTKRNDFSGRIIRHFVQVFMGDKNDVIFTDYGPCWETLRQVLLSAVRKYSVDEKLAVLVVDVVDEVAEQMVKKGEPVDPADYTYLAVYSIIACSSFGHRYSFDDQEFVGLRSSNDRLNKLFDEGVAFDAIPIMKYVSRGKERRLRAACQDFVGYFEKHLAEHKKTYKKGVVRDFFDALLASRDEAEEESKESAQYLVDKNLIGVTMNLFAAGTETTRLTINWMLLYVSNFPDVQAKMQREIDENIGSRDPVQSDRDVCPYIQTCITELLRVRPVVDYTVQHRAIFDTELGSFKVAKDTSIFFNLASCHQDEKLWPEAGVFKPERFLNDDGSFNSIRPPGYMPFGLGRRACAGEKLALADVFLIVVRFLQKFNFELEGGPGTANLEPNIVAFANHPHPYKVLVTRRNRS